MKNGKVLVIGAGGLGCPVAIYLASAGVGKFSVNFDFGVFLETRKFLGELGIVDYDEVELNNLHRQIGHNERRLHKSKAESLKETVMRYVYSIYFLFIYGDEVRRTLKILNISRINNQD